MVEPLSPLAPEWTPGTYGNVAERPGVVLSETRPGSIVEAAAWHGTEKALIAAIAAVTDLAVPDGAGGGAFEAGKGAFGIGPGRFLVVDQAEGLAARLAETVLPETGTVTDLSHGRTALRVAGPKAEWVLAKFFAIDFAPHAFPLGAGRATQHHDILAQIQRSAPDAFDLYVFRSLARSFWKALRRGAKEVGYEVR